MKKAFLLMLMMLLSPLFAMAQDNMFVVSGVVRDDQTGKRLSQVCVTSSDGHETTVTNVDGRFTLKTSKAPSSVVFSCLGYKTIRVILGESDGKELKVRMQPGTITLNEVIVSAMDAREIVEAAIDKIPENYSRNNELLQCFYRETTQKGRRYIYVAEAVTRMFKTGYNRLTGVDRVAIEKGRRLVNPHLSDTLSAKIQGGPTLPVALDLMKNRELLLNHDELGLYHFRMEIPTMIDDRPQVVVSFAPKMQTDHVLYRGLLYIDRQTLAFSRIEMSLDMSNEQMATEAILISKPLGVRFRPREMTTTVSYRFDGDVWRMHYLHSEVQFYCEWRRKLFASPFKVDAEVVITDLLSEDAPPIRGGSSFNRNASFYDKVSYFSDPEFWKGYNIIEPSETLEHAVNKLKKKSKGN